MQRAITSETRDDQMEPKAMTTYRTPANSINQSRKGDINLTTYYLIWTIILVMIGISLMQYATRITSDTRFEKIKTATDIALTATASTIPSANYAFTLPGADQRIRLESGQAAASMIETPKWPGSGSATAVEEKVQYGLDMKLPMTSRGIESGKQIQIVKDDSMMIIQAKETGAAAGTYKLNRPRCEHGAGLAGTKIAIDPGHGGLAGEGDTGAQAETASGKALESETTTKIAQGIAASLRQAGIEAALTRPDNSALEQKTRMERIPPGSALISIHAHKAKIPDQATITIHINDVKNRQQSASLACQIIDRLLDPAARITGPGFSGGNIVPLDPWLYPLQDEMRTIEKPAVGAIIEINGIDLQSSRNPVLGKETEIGRKIAEAIMS